MRQYEITYLTANEQDSPKVGELLSSLGANISREVPLGTRRMSYPIKKLTSAFYSTIVFNIEPERLGAMESRLRLAPFIVRHLIVARPTKKVDVKKEEARLERLEDSREEEPIAAPKEEVAEKPTKKPRATKETAAKKTAKEPKAPSEKERQKVLDEELKKILEEEF